MRFPSASLLRLCELSEGRPGWWANDDVDSWSQGANAGTHVDYEIARLDACAGSAHFRHDWEHVITR
jgi:hypothetical protein